ncbi:MULTISPECIES: hypothetical protein [Clostridium]|uniref:hypothetical protein n=1 Tax=Clostridium TaxID=1485 RepID=UPI00069F3F03|nr:MULTISPECIES: hypothetical protein [Clostridium]KOF55769.1 hypothetical protein AGR56_18325 [Clostridium sp. DMHC 10]MCD2349056.1 hypothetical protein [Clostridium guangxiense]
MENKNVIAIIVAFVLIAIIKIIGIENIPFPVIIIILVLCSLGMFLSVMKYKGSKKERVYLLIMTILSVLLFSVLIIWVSVDNNYPQISKYYRNLFIVLIAIIFFSLLIIGGANAIYKYNKGYKSKKQK